MGAGTGVESSEGAGCSRQGGFVRMVQVQGTRLEPLERLEPVSSPNFFSLDGKRNTTFIW